MKAYRRTFLSVLLCAAGFTLVFSQQTSGPRYALVIGNSRYQHVTQLRNPSNDATDMAATLKALGFSVDLIVNADLAGMVNGVVRLGNQLATSRNAVGFFYYAGHGVQSSGSNYLVPTNADIPSPNFLGQMALDMQSVLATLQSAGNKLNIVVLDACRNNPFPWSRSGIRGLTVVGSQPPGSIIVYATGAGGVAQDGNGRNGVFTGELLKHLSTPNTDISTVFRDTGAAVQADTDGRQIPAIYTQYFGTFQLAVSRERPASIAEQPTEVKPKLSITQSYGSLSISTLTSGTLYLNGMALGAMPAGHGRLDSVAPGTQTIELHYADGHVERRIVAVASDESTAVTFTYQPPPPQAPPTAHQSTSEPTPPTTKHVSPGPPIPAPHKLPPVQKATSVDNRRGMVLVEGGSFTMGSPPSETGRYDSEIAHTVNVSSFYISKHEVTQGLYQDVMHSNPSHFRGDPGRPVENVNWYDAISFCNKLSERDGLQPVYTIDGSVVTADWIADGYRLPTEAEWEYAARGGAEGALQYHAYAGSNAAGDVGWYSRNSGETTHEVGTKNPNMLGLFDMSGNVWEWCWDWYGPFLTNEQTDPDGPASGSERVVRGGAWNTDARDARSANRNYDPPDTRILSLGFRVVHR